MGYLADVFAEARFVRFTFFTNNTRAWKGMLRWLGNETMNDLNLYIYRVEHIGPC
jgi:hypothetical protein